MVKQSLKSNVSSISTVSTSNSKTNLSEYKTATNTIRVISDNKLAPKLPSRVAAKALSIPEISPNDSVSQVMNSSINAPKFRPHDTGSAATNFDAYIILLTLFTNCELGISSTVELESMKGRLAAYLRENNASQVMFSSFAQRKVSTYRDGVNKSLAKRTEKTIKQVNSSVLALAFNEKTKTNLGLFSAAASVSIPLVGFTSASPGGIIATASAMGLMLSSLVYKLIRVTIEKEKAEKIKDLLTSENQGIMDLFISLITLHSLKTLETKLQERYKILYYFDPIKLLEVCNKLCGVDNTHDDLDGFEEELKLVYKMAKREANSLVDNLISYVKNQKPIGLTSRELLPSFALDNHENSLPLLKRVHSFKCWSEAFDKTIMGEGKSHAHTLHFFKKLPLISKKAENTMIEIQKNELNELNKLPSYEDSVEKQSLFSNGSTFFENNSKGSVGGSIISKGSVGGSIIGNEYYSIRKN